MHDHFLERAKRWRARAVVIALCLALATGIVLEAGEPVEPTPEAVAAPMPVVQPASRLATPSFTMPPLRQYGEVLRRPLFSETRRPPLQAAAAQTQLDIELVGIIITPREHRALIERGRPSHLERIVEGQELDDWTVEAIRLDRIVLSRGDNRVEIKVKDKESPVLPVPPGVVARRGRAATPTSQLTPPDMSAPVVVPDPPG